MAAVVMETEGRGEEQHRRPYFSAIRWTAILAGLVGGMGSYLLLSLLGMAIGLTAVRSEAAAGVPVGMGIWTGLVTLVSSFIAGYIAARMSGLARRSDGVLHGFMAWAATMVLFAFLAGTALSGILGGTFAMLGQGIQGGASAAVERGQQGGVGTGESGLTGQLESIIAGREGGDISAGDLNTLQQQLRQGNRQAAIDHMVTQMGFTQQRANQVADMAGPLFSGQLSGEAQQALRGTANTLSSASWWLFIGLALSLLAALFGGRHGVKAYSNRTVGDHLGERKLTQHQVRPETLKTATVTTHRENFPHEKESTHTYSYREGSYQDKPQSERDIDKPAGTKKNEPFPPKDR